MIDPRLVHDEVLAKRRVGPPRDMEVIEGVRFFSRDLLYRGRRMKVSAVGAAPQIERRPPPTLARKRPVDVIGQKVAEASFFDVIGEPLDGPVVGDGLVLECGGADVPGRAGVLDERIAVGPPAEGVVVPVLLGVDEEALVLEVVLDLLVAVFDPTPGVAIEAVDEGAIGLYRTKERQPCVVPQQAAMGFVVVFAKSRREVDDSSAGIERHEVGGDHSPDGRGSDAVFGALVPLASLVGEELEGRSCT